MDYAKESLKKHEEWHGKIEVVTKVPLSTRDDLSLCYTPGVAEPCLAIQKDPQKSFTLTGRGNLVAVVTDGSAVLGLGDIGPEAGMPVMEGKCALFKAFADVDAVPLCIRSKNVDEIVNTVKLIAGSFGGINLEDIAAPRCFEIEKRLKQECEIPVFHDDQHGTAIVVLAAVLNALRVVGKSIDSIRAVINGAGAAGTAIAKLLMMAGLKNLVMCDRCGILCQGDSSLTEAQKDLACVTNSEKKSGTLADAMQGADLMIGVSGPNLVTPEMVRSMAKDAIIFPMANPVPEIMPDLAKESGAAVVGTGRSDFPNQINNVLVFPGVFRGALDSGAREINSQMELAAAEAIADYIPREALNCENIVPSPLDKKVAFAVAEAVAKAARETGVATR
ncbi:MAG: NADP-dependent malic enzyme [Clostridia bacterium]|nr:NADP-dependent malic enzyme [Clostridia bacterium]